MQREVKMRGVESVGESSDVVAYYPGIDRPRVHRPVILVWMYALTVFGGDVLSELVCIPTRP